MHVAIIYIALIVVLAGLVCLWLRKQFKSDTQQKMAEDLAVKRANQEFRLQQARLQKDFISRLADEVKEAMKGNPKITPEEIEKFICEFVDPQKEKKDV